MILMKRAAMDQKYPSVELFEIHGFESLGEYKRFVRWLSTLVIVGACDEIAPSASHGDSGNYVGRLFRFPTGETWQLDPPDFPFRGSWQQVK